MTDERRGESPDLEPRSVLVEVFRDRTAWAHVMARGGDGTLAVVREFGPFRNLAGLRGAVEECHPDPSMVSWVELDHAPPLPPEAASPTALLPVELVRGQRRPRRLVASFPKETDSVNWFGQRFGAIDVMYGRGGYSVWFADYRHPAVFASLRGALDYVCVLLEREVPEAVVDWARAKAIRECRASGPRAVAARMAELLDSATGGHQAPPEVSDPFGLGA